MKKVKHYDSFNERRYGNPWIAEVDPKTGKPDFSKKVGGYTGGYNRGEEGELYVEEPRENTIYMYGQKDYRGKRTEREYVLYRNGEFISIAPADLIDVCNGIVKQKIEKGAE